MRPVGDDAPAIFKPLQWRLVERAGATVIAGAIMFFGLRGLAAGGMLPFVGHKGWAIVFGVVGFELIFTGYGALVAWAELRTAKAPSTRAVVALARADEAARLGRWRRWVVRGVWGSAHLLGLLAVLAAVRG
ncbi:MAG TPA: hypothetical protein PK677_10745 [Acidiphilium sp.]|nr:hypothetical protein [Acidiphilium sp.]HQU24111.1 hypothetical protein [Acidiphilium sp.]